MKQVIINVSKEGFIMKIQIYGKNIEVTPAMEERINTKLKNLEKYSMIGEDDLASVVVRVYPRKKEQKIEVTIPTKYAILRAEVTDNDLYNAIDQVVDRLEGQIRKQKTRLSRKNKEGLGAAFADEQIALLSDEYDESEDVLVKTKSINPEEMNLDDAITQMELLSHSFFIYRDDENGDIAVVYKRHDGGYGLIETE